MLEFKKLLYKRCVEYADERIATIESALLSSHEASVNDTKSSAGDKYETTREMMQQEISRNTLQLMEAKKLRLGMDKFSSESCNDSIKPGSYVETSNGNFYISISAGQLHAGGKTVYAISLYSPIGRLLSGKTSGDEVSINDKSFKILKVY